MKTIKRFSCLSLCAAMIVALLSFSSFAVTDSVESIKIDNDQLTKFLKDLNPFSGGILKYITGTGAVDCPLSTTIMGMLVDCMSETVHEAVDEFTEIFYNAVSPFTTAFMTLAVMLFGIEVALGEPQMVKRGFQLIFRLGAVALYSKDLNGNTDNIFATMSAAQDMVTDHLLSNTLSTALGLFSCPVGSAINFAANDSSNLLWVRLDCILMDLVGIGTKVTLPVVGEVPLGNPDGLAGGLFGILLGLLFSGGFGVACFLFGISTLLSLIFFAMRVAYTFIVAYILVGFLIVIAPLMIPFLMFPRYLGSMFDRWWMNLAGAMALPAMLFAFLSIVVVMLDVAVFNPYNPFALRGLLSSKEMSEAHRLEGTQCQIEMIKNIPFFKNLVKDNGDNTFTPTAYGDDGKYIFGQHKNYLTPTQSGAFNICDYFKVPKLDFVTAKDSSITQGSFLIRLAICLFTTMIISVLTLRMYDSFATIAVGIFGGGGSVMLAATRNAPLQAEVTGAVNSVAGGFQKAFSGARSSLNSGLSSMVTSGRR